MSNRDHLVSELRPDKNGNMVNRWVKPADQKTAAARVPAPSVAVMSQEEVVDRKILLGELMDIISATSHETDDTYDQLCNLDTDALCMLIEYYDADSDNDDNIGRWVAYYHTRSSYVRELATYADAFDSSTDQDYLEMAVDSLREYGELREMDDYSKADPETKEFIHGLLKITDYLYGESFDDDADATPKVIDDAPLRELLFTHRDKSQEILGVIAERDTTDADTIREVITSPVPVLSEGVL